MAMLIKAGNRNAVKYALRVMRQGGLIIYPTESSYGIGADFGNEKAVRRIFRIKGRTKGRKLPVIFGSIAAIRKYAVIDKNASALIRKFMPGPLTLVVPARKGGTIAFRIPSRPFALSLAKQYRKPITATSANISGKPPLYKVKDVLRIFGGSVDLIIDAGDLPRKKPSTIYDVARKKVLRRGPVREKEILKALR
ncbi:MAG: threonylcarbamoyl-AMP synthase [Candidatus Aenigmarchaeota archaeon]|nr:threonylcarbamoyl-AMP synthase [Candidatus Aenigmarchaeota archaeon]